MHGTGGHVYKEYYLWTENTTITLPQWKMRKDKIQET